MRNPLTCSFLILALLAGGCASCERRAGIAQQTPAPAAKEAGQRASEAGAAEATRNTMNNTSDGKVQMTEAQWRQKLTPEQYAVLREKGTERAFTGKYWNTKSPGVYTCAGCGVVLFESGSKFDSGCGWPSFDKMAAAGVIHEHKDTTHGMVRTEVTCARCGGHLGHVFDDGPTSTGLRYCINSASIEHASKEDAKVEAPKK